MDAVGKLADLRRRKAAPYLLELDLTHPLLEERPSDPLGRWQSRRRAVLSEVLRALKDAAVDPKVCGLVAKVGGRRMGFAQVQELRAAVEAFRGSGKPAVAWSETFGEFGPATLPYYVASAFEDIWLQPSGQLGLNGLSAGSLFFAEALDKAGVSRQFGARHEYKNAADIFLVRSFTEPQREATGRVVTSLFDQVVAGVSESRHLEPEIVRSLVDRAPLTAKDALEANLVDRLGYRDEVYADTLEKTKSDAQLLFAQRYRAHEPVHRRLSRVLNRDRPVVALVTGTGSIRLGNSAHGPGQFAAMGSGTVGAAMRAAASDQRVKALVFRVNSPGGSYVASDAIWREVGRVREAGKPVVVSMGDVAASGGYFVSAPADIIVAQPGTITGSIGVIAGKMSVSELLSRFGVSHDAISLGRHARIMSALDEFSEEEFEQLSAWLDQVYEDFVAKVAEGRSMTVETVHEVAKGRIWTGADAKEKGLVDELGGLERAVSLARSRADLADDTEVVRLPQVPLASRLRSPRSSDDPAAASAGADGWGALTALATRLGLPPAGPLTMWGSPLPSVEAVHMGDLWE